MNRSVYAVILAGGSGTRLWPLSREYSPKFLLHVGPGLKKTKRPKSRSLLRQTAERLQGVVPLSRIRIVCGRRHVAAIRRDWPGLPRRCLMAEPVARNTAAAIGWAAWEIVRRDPEAVILFLPADHRVRHRAAFRSVLRRAVSFIRREDRLLILGVRPNRPETGFGYIKRGKTRKNGAYEVKRFLEKPSLARARRFVRDGRHLWNAGIFLGRAKTFLEEIFRWDRPLRRGLRRLERGASLKRVYRDLPSISFDYAVMEKSRRVSVLPADFGWSDVGNLKELLSLKAFQDGQGSGPRLDVGSENLLVSAPSRLVATFGVKDLMIVDTPDVLLIADRRRPHRVREVVLALKGRGLASYA